MIAHPLSARVAGQASRRGLIPRVPSADRLLGDVEAWLTAGYPDVVRSTHRTTAGAGDARLEVALHPAAPDLVLTAWDSGQITAAADTVVVGPGYHRFVGRVLERMETDQSISWTRDGTSGGTAREEAAALTFAERATAERGYLAWLGPALAAARAARLAGRSGIQLGLSDDVRFHHSGAIATALGPRDDAWLDVAVADTRVAVDATPWWADATDGRYLLNRALSIMWLGVRWRTPALKEEGLLLDEVHRLLSKAYPLDPTLPFPWQAWAEVVTLRGIDDPMVRQVVPRAMREPGGPDIGYRRVPVTIVHEGWALEVPGSFAERRSPDEWWGGGAGRSVTLAAVQTGTADGAMSGQAFVEQFASDMGPDAIDHHAGAVVGRARLSTDASSGVEVGVLDGYSAVVGSGAAIRIVFDDPGDWQWAIDTWRSLAPA